MHAQQPCCVPLSYQYAVQSMLYALLQENPQYSAFLHDSGHGTHRQFKLFTFGRLTGRGFMQQMQLHFTETVFLEVRSCDATVIGTLLTALLPGKRVQIADAQFMVLSAALTDEKIQDTVLKLSVPTGIGSKNAQGFGMFQVLEK